MNSLTKVRVWQEAAVGEEFTTDHWVTVQHTPRRYPF
jgi:hypothetical protein